MDETSVRFVSGILAVLCIVPIAIFVKYVAAHKSNPPGSVGFFRDEMNRCMDSIRAIDAAERVQLLARLNTEFEALLGRISGTEGSGELKQHLLLVANQRQAIAADAMQRSIAPSSDARFVAIRLYELTASALLLHSEKGDPDAKLLADEAINSLRTGL